MIPRVAASEGHREASRTPKAAVQGANVATVRVWDPLVRASHWIVLGLVASLLVTGFTGDQENHTALGVDVLVLVLVRIAWGLADSGHAAFRNFVYPPIEVIRYGLSILHGHPARYLGHNPAGGLMAVALFANLLILGISGVFLQAELEYEGWLVGVFSATDETVMTVLGIHKIAVWTLLTLIPLHLLGVVVASRQHRENLVLAMITGDKSLSSTHQEKQHD